MENAFILYGVSSIAITAALTWVIRKTGIQSKWLPLVSLGFGLLVSFVSSWTFSTNTIMYGIIIGLSASGAFDNISKAKEIINE